MSSWDSGAPSTASTRSDGAGQIPTNRSYLAGYFDGEGCIVYNAEGNAVRAEVTNTYPAILEEFRVRYGGTVYRSDGRRTRPGYRPCWRWYVSGQSALVFLADLKEHLKEKRDQAELVLEAYRYGMAPALRQRFKERLALLKRLCHDHAAHNPAD